MKKLPIPDSALDDRLGFVGIAGSGKTYGAGTRVERLLETGARVVICDPLGVWWGLRALADGKGPSGFDVVIFGGPHGDLPLNEHAGALIGQTVATMSESAIVDLSELGTKAAERRFMLAFLTAVYKHATGEPVHVVFDEADMWAPQQLRDKEGESARLLGMMETVVRRGRIKGFLPWLITQRPAVLNKDVLSQVDGLVAFKLTSVQDRDAIGDWVQGQADRERWKAIWSSLPTLQCGEGVVWVPGRGVLETIVFPEKITFDSSRTPKRGEKKRTTALKPLDVAGLKEKLASVEAEAKANDPRLLKGEISRLQKELRAKPQVNTIDPKVLEEAEQRGYARGVRVNAEKIIDLLGGLQAKAGSLVEAIGKVAAQLEDYAKRAPLPKPAARPLPSTPRSTVPRATPASPTGGDGQLSGPHHRLLDAVAWWRALGFERPSRVQVAFVAGYKPGTGTFNTYLGSLSSSGMIAYPQPGYVSLTESGEAHVSDSGGTPSQDELLKRVYEVISGPQRKLLEPLLEKYPDAISRDDLAEITGYQPGTGTFNTYLGSMSSLEIVEYPQRGFVKAADWLFP